jgi:subtilisin-like proprotein convertase family protein
MYFIFEEYCDSLTAQLDSQQAAGNWRLKIEDWRFVEVASLRLF